jgi:hypothetical protein
MKPIAGRFLRKAYKLLAHASIALGVASTKARRVTLTWGRTDRGEHFAGRAKLTQCCSGVHECFAAR